METVMLKIKSFMFPWNSADTDSPAESAARSRGRFEE